MLVTLLIIVCAYAVAIVLNRVVRPAILVDDEPYLDFGDAFAPLLLLTVVVLAFIFLQASQSYTEARAAAGREAQALDTLYETADSVKGRARRRLQASAVCYARAVAGPEWTSQAAGTSSPVPNNWTGIGPQGFRSTFQQLGPGHPLFAALTQADQMRGDARRDRLFAAQTPLPAIVLAFMTFLTCAVSLMLAFVSPWVDARGHLIVVAAFTFAFLAALVVINDLSRPFGGAVRIGTTAMRDTSTEIAATFKQRYGGHGIALPCDAAGQPKLPRGLTTRRAEVPA